METEGILELEAKGYVRDIKRPVDPKCTADFEGEGLGKFKQYKYFEHTRPLDEKTLNNRGETPIPVEQQAFNIGQKKVAQVNKLVAKGLAEGPDAPSEVLVNVQLDDIVDPVKKMSAVQSCLNGVETANGDTSMFLFTGLD